MEKSTECSREPHLAGTRSGREGSGARFQMLVSALAAKPIIWLVFVVTMFTWPILRSIQSERELPERRPVLGRVRDFTLRDQNGGALGTAELRGRIWVASFTATECEPACAEARHVLGKMEELRHRTRNLGDTIRLVTFSVDPDRDTAERMLELAATHRASRGPWRFVSGPRSPLREVLSDFHVAEGLPQTHLALVDGEMRIRGSYDLADDAALHVLLRDIGLLLSLGG
jgi:protein SCO1/2